MSAQDVADQIARRSARGTTQVRYGAINPTTEGVDGDFYINQTSHYIFGPKAGGVWPAGVALVGTAGAAGATGSTGATGAVGTAGHSVLYGSANPQASDGSDGDFWVNTTAHTFFGPKAAGSWLAGTSLVGPTGSAGATGAAGAAGADAAQPIYRAGSGSTSAANTLANITGMTVLAAALAPNTTYEFTALLKVTSNVVLGQYLGISYNGTGGDILCAALCSTVSAGSAAVETATFINSFDTLQGPVNIQNGIGFVMIKGRFLSGTVTGNFIMQHSARTGGDSVVNDAFMILRKVA